MRPFFSILLSVIAAIVCPLSLHAQFSGLVQMAQAQQVMSMFSYKGFIEAGYNAGVGYYKANKFEATTSHGLSSGNFFMGVGAGVDILKTEADEYTRWEEDMDLSDNAYMIPLFLDFRYMGSNPISAFVDAKTGVSFLVGNDYITINDGIIDNEACFYLSCSIGVRIALGSRSAFNLGVNYSLINQRYYRYDDYYYYDRYDGISLHSIGVVAGLEW